MPVSSSLWSRAVPFRSVWLLRNSESSQSRSKDGPEQKNDMAQSPQHQRLSTEQNTPHPHPSPAPTEHTPRMVLQKDFRKVSGISTEIFRQIETLENDLDDIAASAMEAVERKGEMIVCILNPQRLSKNAFELASKFLDLQNAQTTIQFVEIVKRPGQTLGLYIREGNGSDRCDGVFVSRIAIESAVYNSGCLCVGDEVVAVNLVDVRRMGLDDVVIIMSIPRRLVLTIRQKKHPSTGAEHNAPILWPESKYNPVVVMKKELDEEPAEGLMRMSGPPPSVAPPPLPPRRQRMQESPYKYIKGPPMNCQPNKPPSYHDLYSRTRRSPYSSVGHQMAGRGLQSSDSWHSDASSVMSYQPPPPMATDPHRGSPSSLYDRATYSKALDSLAHHVKGRHMDSMMRPINSMYMASGVSNGYCSLPRNETPYRMRGRGVMRANSDQRLPQTESSGRDYSMSPVVGGNLPSTLLQHPMRYSETMRRLSAMRRRTASLDYASDSETMVGSRMMMHHRQRQQYQHQYSGSPSAQAQSAMSAVNAASRSNSLPRDNMPPYRSRFNRMSGYNSSGTMDSQDESDGAISAPEVAARRGVPLPGMRPPSDYGQWMSRAPSTSAIYERIRSQREAAPSPSMTNRVKFTLSEENIQNGFEDVAGYPYKNKLYPMRSQTPTSMHLGRPMSSTITNGTNSLAPLSQRLKNLLEERGATPTPPPGQESRFSVLNINPAEYLRYKSERSSSPSTEGVSGMLFVHLLSGRGLKPTTRSQQLRDLYCVLECDHIHKARTVIRTGDLVFDWDETFELDIIENRDLDFLIYSWDPQFRHKLCYKGSVSINTLLRESNAYQLAIKLEPHGSLYVQLRYTEPKRCFQRAVTMSHSSLFGADLESVVAREATGTGVPILVKRCIEEVERRGLDIIGLYRLCGSASKKSLLRETFEKNPRAVDLSPDNIPDINVITGVLKDYLRELPEPLFTKCLYQMLCDALSVCLPDDPEGNAKLIFSILDCLPKVNRSTLMCVMDHLRLVTSQSECNKMTPQNVAICFGPVFMIHSEIGRSEVDFHRPISVLKYLLRIWMTKTDREAVAVKAAPPIRRVRPSPLAASAQRKELANQVAHEERSDPPTTTTDSGSESRESSPNRAASRPGSARTLSRKPVGSATATGNGSSSHMGAPGPRGPVFPEAPVAPTYLRQSGDSISQMSATVTEQQTINSALSPRSEAAMGHNKSHLPTSTDDMIYIRNSVNMSLLKNGNMNYDSSDTEQHATSNLSEQQPQSQTVENHDRGSLLGQSNGSNPFHSDEFSRKDQQKNSNPFQQVHRNSISFQNGSSLESGDSRHSYVSHENSIDHRENIQKPNTVANAQNIFAGNNSEENGQYETSVLNGQDEPLDLT